MYTASVRPHLAMLCTCLEALRQLRVYNPVRSRLLSSDSPYLKPPSYLTLQGITLALRLKSLYSLVTER